MKRTARLLAASLLAAMVSLAFALPADAAPKKDDPPAVAGQIALHNDTAGAQNDCPADGNAYWHFVLAPNNGSFSFTLISLNLGTGSNFEFAFSPAPGQYPILPNGTQTDNVFVPVPMGSTLDSLIASGSFADYTGPAGRTPNNFNLSGVCAGYSGGAPAAEVLSETVSDPTDEAQVLAANAVAPSGALPYTGNDSTVPFVQIGVALLAAGALITFAVRRRSAGQGV